MSDKKPFPGALEPISFLTPVIDDPDIAAITITSDTVGVIDTASLIRKRRQLKDKKSALEKEAKEIEKEVGDLEDQIMAAFVDKGIDGEIVDGTPTKMSVEPSFSFTNEHLEPLMVWLKENNLSDLIKVDRRSFSSTVREALKRGELKDIPEFVSSIDQKKLSRK